MTIEDELAITPYFPQAVVPAERGGWGRNLTPMHLPVTIPDYLAEWQPNTKELYAPTPKDYRRVATDKQGKILYRYVPISFIIKRLNKAFDSPFGPQWGMELIREEWGEWTGEKRPYTCIAQLTYPGMWRPIVGVGTSYFYSNNPQESEAKTRNAAWSSALKSAAKQLGIGRDVEEDDPEIAGVIDDRVRVIDTLLKAIKDRGGWEEVLAVVRKIEPGAVLDNGNILVAAIEFEHMEPLQRELQRIALTTAKAK